LIHPVKPIDAVAKDDRGDQLYLTRNQDEAIWDAELATGEGAGRVFTVESTGPVEDDPNLTDKRFRGNPTKSFRSRSPLRVSGEVVGWQGHSSKRYGR
jgi:rifampin ADP-ribosylating transferase